MSHEFRNAYATGGEIVRARNATVHDEIDAAIAAGRFPVVLEGPAYCPFTDGVLPFPALVLEGAYATRAEAEAVAGGLNDDAMEAGGWDGEAVVYPKPPRVSLPCNYDEDVPF